MTLKPAYRYLLAVRLLRFALVDRAYMAAMARKAAKEAA